MNHKDPCPWCGKVPEHEDEYTHLWCSNEDCPAPVHFVPRGTWNNGWWARRVHELESALRVYAAGRQDHGLRAQKALRGESE